MEYGLENYAHDPTTDVWCMAYCLDDGPIELWTPDQLPPFELFEHMERGGLVAGHNVNFEVNIINKVMAKKYNWPKIKIEQCTCTMVRAYSMGLPGKLEKVAPALGLDVAKDKEGQQLMLMMSQPRRLKRAGKFAPKNEKLLWWDEPEKIHRLGEYCKQDVEVERQVDKKLLDLSEREKKIWHMDFHINSRGLAIDSKAAKRVVRMIELEELELNRRIKAASKNEIASATSVADIKRFVESKGVKCSGVSKAEVDRILSTAQDTKQEHLLPKEVKEVLTVRREAAKSSTAKLETMLKAVSEYDSRVRWIFQYYGAPATGRWAGRRVQPHNFPRPSISQNDIEWIFDHIFLNESLSYIDAVESLRMFYGSPLQAISDCLRGFLKAKEGHYLIGMDYSAIEARVIGWLAGEIKLVKLFKEGGKVYEQAASDIYRKSVDSITAIERLVGKVAVLALGFQGGKVAFQQMAKNYGIKVSDDEADSIKTKWREAHPRIVSWWYDLESAAFQAVRNPGKVYHVVREYTSVRFVTKGSFLFCELPSRRCLCYPYPQIQEIETPWGAKKQAVTYKAEDQNRKWVRMSAYGGLFAENITQATARDILADAMLSLHIAKIPIVLHVHDEIVVEIPDESRPLEYIQQLMTTPPAWAKDLPLDIGFFQGKRYEK